MPSSRAAPASMTTSSVRVGSANLNNRSMGADTECDLAIEAKNDTERTAILRLRNYLAAKWPVPKGAMVA